MTPRPFALMKKVQLAGLREEWLQRVEDANPELQALRKQLEAAELAVSQMRSGHLPALDLVAAEQRGRNETHTTVGSQYTTDYVGVQVEHTALQWWGNIGANQPGTSTC